MFLQRLVETNPRLASAAFGLHRSGSIPPNTWVIDLDAVADNANALAAEARRLGLTTYLMTKQFGRNPYVTGVGLQGGLDSTVCVDITCALQLTRYGLPIGHLGHLTQVPHALVEKAVGWSPDVITVFNFEHARWISDAASRLGVTQDLLLKVYSDDGVFFEGQEGGTPEPEVLQVARKIAALPGVRVVGTTAFPCVRYDAGGEGAPELTPNFATAVRCAKALEADGFPVTQVNTPGNTSSATMELLARNGSTHVEPGHGLTGTTPIHARNPDLPERPAFVYVSEISHHFRDAAYAFGGGLFQDIYPAGYPAKALVGGTWEQARDNALSYRHEAEQIIDYHAILEPGDRCAVGDTALFGFRTQMQMTRSYVAPVSGISTGEPRVHFLFDNAATALDPVTFAPVAVQEVVGDLQSLLPMYAEGLS
jgi:predicted amino acid racemase